MGTKQPLKSEDYNLNLISYIMKSTTSVASLQMSIPVQSFSLIFNLEIEIKCKNCGMDEIISKPITKTTLEEKLRVTRR